MRFSYSLILVRTTSLFAPNKACVFTHTLWASEWHLMNDVQRPQIFILFFNFMIYFNSLLYDVFKYWIKFPFLSMMKNSLSYFIFVQQQPLLGSAIQGAQCSVTFFFLLHHVCIIFIIGFMNIWSFSIFIFVQMCLWFSSIIKS